MKLSNYAIPCTVLIVLLTMSTSMGNSAFAEKFGITLDKTCITLLKNNIGTNCPTYNDIMMLYSDSSLEVSSFGYEDNLFQRIHNEIINFLEYFRYDKQQNHIFVDPPNNIREQIKVIEIRSNFEEFRLPLNKSYNATEHSITLGVGRYVEKCHNAYIDSERWIDLLGDTIYFMSKNCDQNFTKFDSTKKTYLGKMEHDITTSYKYKLEQWQKAIKENASNVDELYKELNK